MIPYAAPLQDMRFWLDHIAGPEAPALPGQEDGLDPALVDAILGEAAKLAGAVLAPLNTVGDRNPPVLENGVVRHPDGFREAYAQFAAGGWQGVPFDPTYGGQGLPWVVAVQVMEMWLAACSAFALCPVLNQGAAEALAAHGSAEQKALYLTRLVSGEWTGTMNLTEPQAGSDLSQIRTRAEPAGDGTYRLFGQKIFISWGEHALAPNIVHLVLARLPDAPPGTRGISLFAVPKVLTDPDGTLGAPNDLRCVGLEHKLGIHASPTCVMAYGDRGEGAVGTLVGEANRGLECLFTMMNNARLTIGLQGVALAERAYQQASAFARVRVQSKSIADPRGGAVAIIEHPDVRRMLVSMRSKIDAGRALTTYAARLLDQTVEKTGDPATRARLDLLIPVVKAWCTDMAVEVASTGVQIHGGMGYIEETGAAQHLRDARITTIYEGTNGIQANDLVFRKVLRDGGVAARALFAEMAADAAAIASRPEPHVAVVAGALAEGLAALEAATTWVLDTGEREPAAVASVAVPYLRLFGIVCGGWLVGRSVAAALDRRASERGSVDRESVDPDFLNAKILSARAFADHELVLAAGLARTVVAGSEVVAAFPEAHL